MIKKYLFYSLLAMFCGLAPAWADETETVEEKVVKNIDKNTAQMQAMDKITGRVSMINVPVGGEVKFGTLSIVVRRCQTRPQEEAPDNFAFADITDLTLQGEEINIFKGWMISSSPATHAVEHPIFDVWLLNCLDTKVDSASLLSAEALQKRDEIPMAAATERKPEQIESKADLSHPIAEMTAEKEPEITIEPSGTMPPVEFLYDEDESDGESGEGEETDENASADSAESDIAASSAISQAEKSAE